MTWPTPWHWHQIHHNIWSWRTWCSTYMHHVLLLLLLLMSNINSSGHKQALHKNTPILWCTITYFFCTILWPDQLASKYNPVVAITKCFLKEIVEWTCSPMLVFVSFSYIYIIGQRKYMDTTTQFICSPCTKFHPRHFINLEKSQYSMVGLSMLLILKLVKVDATGSNYKG